MLLSIKAVDYWILILIKTRIKINMVTARKRMEVFYKKTRIKGRELGGKPTVPFHIKLGNCKLKL
jgi:hypothetical protein